MSFLSKAFRRKSEGLPPWAALDHESLRISAAMEHVEKHGNLDDFPGNQSEKLALMLTASRQGLVQWNRGAGQYELTGLGRERLGMRQAMQAGGPMHVEESGGVMNPPPASGAGAPARRWALGSGTMLAGIAGLAIGATAMALMLPGSGSKAPPREQVAAVAPTPPAATPAPGSSPPEPPKAQSAEPPKAQVAEPPKAPEPKQAAIHPGEPGTTAGTLAGAEPQSAAPPAPAPAPSAAPPPEESTQANAAPAPKPEPSRRSERSRNGNAAPPANPEEPGFAQSSEEPSRRATERSSRSRHAEQQRSWTESRRRFERSRRDYAKQDEGEREDGAIVRRFEEGGPPVVLHRGGRGEPSPRRGDRDLREIEERPGFAFREPREPRTFRFGGREEGPPRFGLFDWLFR